MLGSLLDGGSQKSDDISELLGLCSGQFGGQESQLARRLGAENEGDMDELLGLCSGRFTSKTSQSEDSQTNDTLICSQPAAAKLHLLNR